MKKYMQWVVIPVLLVALVMPQGAQAATLTAAQQQEITYLYSLVAQLQAQLDALIASGMSGSQTDNLSVETRGVSSADNDSVELEGRVTFKRDGDARVWFEYGLSSSLLSYSTPSYEFKGGDDGDSETFSLIAPDLDSSKTYYYRAVAEDEDEDYAEGVLKSFKYESTGNSNDDDDDNDEDVPDVSTEDADDIDDNSAELSGEVDMNDYENGVAFMVYGEDESMVEDVEDEDTYDDVDTDGDDLRKVLLSSNLDDDRSFTTTVNGLDEDTEHFYRICVEYDDEDDDETLICGDVESFDTDNN